MEKISEQLLDISGFLSEQLKYSQANVANQVGIILRDNNIHTTEELKKALEKDDVVDIPSPKKITVPKHYNIDSVFGVRCISTWDDSEVPLVFVSDRRMHDQPIKLEEQIAEYTKYWKILNEKGNNDEETI